MKVRKLLEPRNLIPLACLLYSLAFAYRYLVRTLFRTWFFSSDEYVLAAEIIRFSNFDFRQRFFDSPGTFFMMLNTPIWAAFYGVERALGLAPKTGIGPFTFEHIPALFILIRAMTVGCFLLSAVLLFVLVAKLLNPAAAALASLLLLMSPGYSSYSTFGRTESLAMVLMLCAILWLVRDAQRAPAGCADPPRGRDPAVIAGILIGLAAGSRLHSVTASLPALVILLWLQKPFAKPDYPAWVLKWSKRVLPATWAAAGLGIIRAQVGLQAVPSARRFVIAAAVAWMATSGAAVFLYRNGRTRPLIVRLLSPDIIKLGLGCGIGGILGNPTILWQYNYFLGSVQMYSGYVDQERLDWPFWKNATWYFRHYITVAAPDKVTLVLLCLGTIAILIARDRKVIPFLAGAALFFFSKPIWLRASFHHLILWLPFFYIVCSYPVGKAFDWLCRRFRHGEWVAAAALGLGLFLCFQSLTPGPRNATADMEGSEKRMQSIQSATNWLHDNAEPKAFVAISYFCFNPDTFYSWLASLEVPVPAGVFDGREYLIWWGHARALQGRTGYACVTPSDLEAIKYRLNIAEPGQGTDPYADTRFRRVMSFGSGPSEVDLFRFDYR